MKKKFVRTFQERFADLVEQGIKTQTVRKTPKRMPKVGDIFDCRKWTDKPYRSKQQKLCYGLLTEVSPICIDNNSIDIQEGRWLNPIRGNNALDGFATEDGFDDWNDMVTWFKSTHALPFRGVLFKWEVINEER